MERLVCVCRILSKKGGDEVRSQGRDRILQAGERMDKRKK